MVGVQLVFASPRCYGLLVTEWWYIFISPNETLCGIIYLYHKAWYKQKL